MDTIELFDGDGSAVAEEGSTSLIDNESFFNTRIPLAVSTVNKEHKPRNALSDPSKGGSFLDLSSQSNDAPAEPVNSQHGLRMSFSDINQPADRPAQAREITGTKSLQNVCSDPFASNTMETWAGIPSQQLSQMEDRLSRNSSMGIIELDNMSDLSSSMLHLNLPLGNPSNKVLSQQKNHVGLVPESQPQNVVSISSQMQGNHTQQTQSRDRHHSSKNSFSDSHFCKPNLQTIKKRPADPAHLASKPTEGIRQSLQFTGANLGNDNEGDVTIPEVHLMEDELNQLDEDFGDFDDIEGTDSDNDDQNDNKIQGTTNRNGLLDSMKNLTRPLPTESERSADPYPSLSKVTLFDDMESNSDLQSEISTMVRTQTEQFAAGEGGGGDGSSGSDSEGRSGHSASQAQEFLEQFRPSFRPVQPPPSDRLDMEEQRVRPVGDDLLTQKGVNRYSANQEAARPQPEAMLLDPRYLTRTSPKPASDLTSGSQWGLGLGDSTWCSDDLLKGLEQSGRLSENQRRLTKEEVPHNKDDLNPKYHRRTSPVPSSDVMSGSQFGSRLENNTFLPDDSLRGLEQSDKPSENQQSLTKKETPTETDDPFGAVESSFGSFGASPAPEDSLFTGQVQEIEENLHRKENNSIPFSDRISGESTSTGYQDIPFDTTDKDIDVTDNQPKSCVYKDEDGEYVTDLAFKEAFSGDQIVKQQEVLAMDFSETDFVSSAKAMLDEDEKEFEKENVFREDEVMPAVEAGPTPETSWMYQSKMTVSCPPSLLDDDDDYTRISIGTFMKSRSCALGSLDGDKGFQRPEFGMTIRTPPENRKPVALLDLTGDGQHNCSSDEAFNSRTSGVGNEDGDSTLIEDKSGDKTVTNSVNVSDTLSKSVIDRCLSAVSLTKSPGEVAEMILSIPSKHKASTKRDQRQTATKQSSSSAKLGSSKREETEGGTQTKSVVRKQSSRSALSRIPIPKGSNVDISRKTSSPGMSRNVKESQGEMRMEDLVMAGNVSREMDKENLFSSQEGKNSVFQKTKPDGEESDDEKVYSRKLNDSGKNVGSEEDLSTTAASVFDDCGRSPRLSMCQASLNSSSKQGDLPDYPQSRSNRYQSRGQQPADGEATKVDLSVKNTAGQSVFPVQSLLPPTTSARSSDSNSLGSSKGSDRMTSREEPSGLVSEKSPVSSANSLGLTGHHIPDGTEYSFQTDNMHHGNNDLGSREDLVGTADIQMADSRGFDVINTQAARDIHSKSPVETDGLVSAITSAYGRNTNQKSESVMANNSEGERNMQTNVASERIMRHQHLTDLRTESDRTVPSKSSSGFTKDKPQPPVSSFNHDLPPKQISSVEMLSQNSSDVFFGKHPPNPEMEQLSHIYLHGSMTKRAKQDNVEFLRPCQGHTDSGHPMYHSTPAIGRVADETQYHTLDATGIQTFMTSGRDLTLTHGKQSGHVHKPLRSQKLAPVEAPACLVFQDVCCIGISAEAQLPLTNPTTLWLDCQLEVTSLTLNGQPVPFNEHFPFSVRSKVLIEGSNTEELTVTFFPKLPGLYIAELTISCQLFLKKEDAYKEKKITVVTLKAKAETPQIQVQTGSNADRSTCIDYGHINWGTCREGYMKIVNKGEAKIPLCLVISSDNCPWHCFTFDQRNSPADISIISRSSRPQTNALGKTVISIFLQPGHSIESPDIQIYCRPPDKQYNRAMAQRPPEKMTARVDIQVDTPSFHLPPLHSIKLEALVGVQKLRIPRDLEIIQLNAAVGQRVEKKVLLMNAGNINLEVLLTMRDYETHFQVNPRRVVILPRTDLEVTVGFMPMDSLYPEYQTVMLMQLLPDGATYELPTRGLIARDSRQATGNVSLLSDKRYLSYGGVPVGQVCEQRVKLLNNSQQSYKVRMEVRSEFGDFQLKGGFSDEATETVSSRVRDVYLQSLEKYPVYVLYNPSRVAVNTGKLIFKPYGTTFKFSIPLAGYGGVSKLIVEGTEEYNPNSYILRMGEMSIGRRCVRELLIKNTGNRPAYVCAVCCIDSRCRHVMANCVVKPSEFVLQEHASKKVEVVLSPSHRECALCTEHEDLVGAVAFFSGDEISRQRFRIALEEAKQQAESVHLTDDELLRSINFNRHYLNEEYVSFDGSGSTVGGPQTNIKLFYNTMSQVIVTLIGEPMKEDMMMVTPALHKRSRVHSTTTVGEHPSDTRYGPLELTADNRELLMSANLREGIRPIDHAVIGAKARGHAENRHDMQLMSISSIPTSDSIPSERDRMAVNTKVLPGASVPLCNKETWMLKPEQLTLYAPMKKEEKPQISRFIIINFVERHLKYELSWPESWLKPLPEQGTLEPKSNTSICVCLSAIAMQNLHKLPWSGSIKVLCENQYQLLKVQIRRDIVLDDSSLLMSSLVPVGKNQLGTTSNNKEKLSGIQPSMTNVTFPVTKIGEQSDTVLELKNYSEEEMQWIISSFTPPHVKDADNTQVFRATYRVFEFSEKFGHLEAGKPTQLCVQFMPRSKGMFIQNWEVQSRGSSLSNRQRSAINLTLSGEGVEEDKTEQYAAESARVTSSATHREKNRDRPVWLKDHVKLVSFPPCLVGAVEIAKISLKNEADEPRLVEVTALVPPFYVKHSKFHIKNKNYVRLPVEFRPKITGKYSAVLELRVDVGYTLGVNLEGECV